jgi:hypothetical protein
MEEKQHTHPANAEQNFRGRLKCENHITATKSARNFQAQRHLISQPINFDKKILVHSTHSTTRDGDLKLSLKPKGIPHPPHG